MSDEYIKIPLEKIEIMVSRGMELRNNLFIRALEELKKEYIDKEYLTEVITKGIEAMAEVDKSFMAVLTLMKDAKIVKDEKEISPTSSLIIEEEEEKIEPTEREKEIEEKLEMLRENNPATFDYLKFIFEKGGKGFSSDFKNELGLHLNTIYDHEKILEEMGLIRVRRRVKGSGKQRFRYITIPEDVFILLEDNLQSREGFTDDITVTPEYNMHGDEGVGEEWDE